MNKFNSKNTIEKGSIAIYKAKSGYANLEVKLENETVWLSQSQMAQLFDKGIPTINEHISNIYKEGELRKNSTIRNFRIVRQEGKRRVIRNIDAYNLDVIISVGYRVKSKQGTRFRIWATKVIRDHLVKGYTLNQKRLKEQTDKIQDLQRAIGFIKDKVSIPELQGQSQELIKIIDEYAKSMTILYEYDKGTLKTSKVKKPGFILTYNDSLVFIKHMKERLLNKNEASDLFANEIDHKFESIVGSLNQTFDGHELYSAVEEKAAHLLYFIIKDHPFSDGNKRIGSMLFIYFLEQNNELMKKSGERKLNENALIALALLIAESDPKEKDVMIKIITNMID